MRDQRRGPGVSRSGRARAGAAVPRRARRDGPAQDQRHGAADRMTIVFWDIDGTLLTTGKAGVPAWETAVRDATGKDFQLSSIRLPGLTDFQIAARTFEILGVPASEDVLARMVTRYEDLLPASLPTRQGRVLR